MTPREIILHQIHHRETPLVLYTLPIEPEVATRLDDHYGGTDWRQRLTAYMAGVAPVETRRREALDGGLARDPYGAMRREDRRPFHLEEPPLRGPTLDGYAFPEPAVFFRPDAKEQARQTCREHSDKFLIGHLGWGLFELSWNLRGFQNVLTDAMRVSSPTLSRLGWTCSRACNRKPPA